MFKILENATLSLSKILNRRTYVVLAAVFFALVLMLPPTFHFFNVFNVTSDWTQSAYAAKDEYKGDRGEGKKKFHLEEATIADIHNAINTNQITCQGLVQLYINRAKAYNGVCNQLVTEDGGSIPPATGVVRAGSPIVFPTTTVLASIADFRILISIVDRRLILAEWKQQYLTQAYSNSSA
jgi:hypothetical protein